MSHITLKVRYKEATNKSTKDYPSLMDKLKGFYHKINEYFDLQEGTSDIIWFYGFAGFCGVIVTLIFIMNVLMAGV